MDRNVTHSYNQNIALSIISQAKEKFYDMFCQLKKEIDENIKFLNDYKNFSSEEKNIYGRERFNAKMKITDFTMSIQGYEVGKNGLYNNETIEVGKNQVIYIFDCEYNKENGFQIKNNKLEKERIEDNFI